MTPATNRSHVVLCRDAVCSPPGWPCPSCIRPPVKRTNSRAATGNSGRRVADFFDDGQSSASCKGKPLAAHRDIERVKAVAPRQTPFAAFLGCADLRGAD